jgi:hypothetical protein
MSETQETEDRGDLVSAIAWRRMDGSGQEHFRLWRAMSSWLLEGTVDISSIVGTTRTQYQVVCSAAWETRVVCVQLEESSSLRTAELRCDERGRWWRDGHHLDGMDGLIDVDLGFTPATNTLPIRRLSPAVGSSVDVTALWVRFPDLSVEALPQRYTRLEQFRYRYESAGGEFIAALEVDELGLVMKYEGGWERFSA